MKQFCLVFLIAGSVLFGQQNSPDFGKNTFEGLTLRNIGPAFTSGRIADIAIHPENRHIWYVAVGSGGVWKTENAGTTWKPVFDTQSSYSIGCVALDQANPHIVWVGTGENVGGRHVGFGDGIYKSLDGGSSWTNMGLKESEHISKILVHPEDSRIVFAAAQGPLWKKGGERGLYKSKDGGLNWKKVLGDDEWTGVTDVVMDPVDPDWMVAATWQRHRNVAAYMGGGPGSGIYRSKDGGETWEKLTKGIPTSNLGKIGLAISPFNRDIVYAAIELDRRKGGLFISRDRGVTWTKQSDAVSGGTGPHYYQELYASPHQEGRLYLMDVRTQVSDDQGKTFRPMNERAKHSDNHSLSFVKDDPGYLLEGTDGGIYESFDLGENWRFVANLPVTQFYKVAVDDREPFYFIYGGTQDNGSQGGPSRTDSRNGIRNADWFSILGADGHQTATEPGNPEIMYAEGQQGDLHRIDRITGEQVYIRPQAGVGESYERFNWDTPILVSPHQSSRIYTASYRVWRSDNRGDSWRPVSGDLTKNQERISQPIMGREQSWDNPWDVYAMSTYNTITSLAESPLHEGLLYAGTDDGIIQVTEDGGRNWRRLEVGSIRGAPATAFVNDLRADLFDERTVYAVLDNHKFGDFTPYLLKSTDAGRTWTSIRGDLPERTPVWRLVQDHVKPGLLFAATEFGIYFTTDGGTQWVELTGGVPTISFRDITIQRREDDLVAASFGRGFFVLDDISPLRQVTPDLLAKEAVLFPVKDALWYVQRTVVRSQGASDFVAGNPPFGAVFTYYVKDEIRTAEQARREKEKELEETGSDIPFPGWDVLDQEGIEEKPLLVFTVRDQDGKVVNRVTAPAKKGINRVNWNLTYSSGAQVGLSGKGSMANSSGYLVTPGTFSVSMASLVDGTVHPLSGEERFEVVPLRSGALDPTPFSEREQFRERLLSLQQKLSLTSSRLEKAGGQVMAMKRAYYRMDTEHPGLLERIGEAEQRIRDLEKRLNGSHARDEVGEKQLPTPGERAAVASRGMSTTYGPTPLHHESLELGLNELGPISEKVNELHDSVLPSLLEALRSAGAPLIEGQ